MESHIQTLLKIRYKLDPDEFDFDDPYRTERLAEQHYCHEVQAIQTLSDLGLGPTYLDGHATLVQSEWMPFPGGYMDYIIMKPPLDQNVDEIKDELHDRQLGSIRTQLMHILE